MKFAAYWRNSLADAELGRGAWKKTDLAKEFIPLPRNLIESGVLDSKTLDTLFKDEPKNIDSVDLIIRPEAFALGLEHGARIDAGMPEVVTPIICAVRVNRTGRIFQANKIVIARDILDPLERGNFAIGEVAALDDYLTVHSYTCRDDGDLEAEWRNYLAYCQALKKAVICGWPQVSNRYQLAEVWYLKKIDNANSPSKHVIKVYDDLRTKNPDVPLFSTYAAERRTPDEECLPKNAVFEVRYAHSSDMHPLADAQRDALSHLLKSKLGEIVAVNGPPGTGKTTMLLAVVATLWAKAAIEKSDPPIVVAASTNNQAVTNIIDAFGKGFRPGTGYFAGRWLPGIRSFGAYFPSMTRATDASAKYQTAEFFNKVESTDYLESARAAYIEAGKRAFPLLANATVSSIVESIHAELRKESDRLTVILDTWAVLERCRQSVRLELGDDPGAELARRDKVAQSDLAKAATVRKALKSWNDHLAQESIWLALFSWIPAVARKRLAMALHALDAAGVSPGEAETMKALEDMLKHQVASQDGKAAASAKCAEIGHRLTKDLGSAQSQWQGAVAVLSAAHTMETLAEADRIADTTIRFKIFLLTTHYWEGRWLLSMIELGDQIEDQKKRKGRKVVEARWRRRMMLTPCVVSTFFMLPTHMKCKRHDGEGFTEDYLYNFVDLLVVDEAGQVLPEVAGASFALAKRALVIGDTLQIEPIWAIPSHVDVGNLIAAKVLSLDAIDSGFEAMRGLGKVASSGSVMQIAQNASRYHYAPELPRGLFLFEHRRCLAEIIQFCNQLCYHGKLIPCREPNISPIELPAMGYLHIDGICTQGSSGSRQNKVEAKTIAAWIADHREMLEGAYGEPIHKILAVVTPFAGQSKLVCQECSKRGIAVGTGDAAMTIGTVHALQGAERHIIIFSPTYSKHANGGFIDQRTSMLNVAVSRAKDSFLVFGDMDTFNLRMKSQPRGLLATFLFRDDESALLYPPVQRADITGMGNGLKVLHDAEEHDAFMQEALGYAMSEVMIVTPWFKMGKLKSSGALDAMLAARARGIKISIYTDRDFNRGEKGASALETNELALNEARNVLKSFGISLLVVNKIHSKIVACDDDLLCIGSFNWFGAARSGKYKRHETSLVYQGNAVANEIAINRNSLQAKIGP